MNKEKQEQIKILLLGIIAVVLIIQTGMRMSSENNTGIAKNTGTQVQQNATSNPVTPGLRSVTVPIDPSQKSLTLPASSGQPVIASTTMVFEQKDFDLGTVIAGTSTRHTFKFTNRGSNPLKLGSVRADEGASVISWPNEPIPQGGTGEIIVEFGGNIPPGLQQKIIHVSANTEPPHEHLTLQANVK